MVLSNDEQVRYSRQIIVSEIGVKGQLKLKSSRVLVIGAGGLGSPAALYLAAAGVGTIGLIDNETVDLSNLQRQILHTVRDIGLNKVQSGERTLKALNPDITVIPVKTLVTSENIAGLMADYDFIIDATDNFSAKFLINDACVLQKKPFVHAGVIRFNGQLMTYVPGQGPCYRCLFDSPPDPTAVPTCSQAGIVGAMAGVIGSLEAMEAIKYLAGFGTLLTGAILIGEALNMEFRKIKVPRREDCPVCGEGI
jgi:molybdopterin/thiamine biosynthesis adenylyltransferase